MNQKICLIIEEYQILEIVSIYFYRKRDFLLPRVLQDSGSIFECFRNGPGKNLPRLSAKAPGGV